MKKFRLHWSLHPHRDVDWYKQECSRLTKDMIAKDLDINYIGAISGQVFEDYNPRRHITNVMPKMSPRNPIYRIWDFGNTNATLYIYVDESNRKYFLHERVLRPNQEEKSSTDVQIQIALSDSNRLFPDFRFVDICDPSGALKHHSSMSADTHNLNKHGIYPLYEKVLKVPTQKRTSNGISIVKSDLQRTSGSKEFFNIYVNGSEGCNLLCKALEGGYSYQVDGNGNVLDRIDVKRPYEDLMDCVYYFYFETQFMMDFDGDEEMYAVTSNELNGNFW